MRNLASASGSAKPSAIISSHIAPARRRPRSYHSHLPAWGRALVAVFVRIKRLSGRVAGGLAADNWVVVGGKW
jgi:hypothetical protein